MMKNITVHRFTEEQDAEYAACAAPIDWAWALLIRRDGAMPELYDAINAKTLRATMPISESNPKRWGGSLGPQVRTEFREAAQMRKAGT